MTREQVEEFRKKPLTERLEWLRHQAEVGTPDYYLDPPDAKVVEHICMDVLAYMEWR